MKNLVRVAAQYICNDVRRQEGGGKCREIGGGGIYFEAHSSGQGDIAVRHDKNTTDKLAVMGNKGHGLVRTGYAITK